LPKTETRLHTNTQGYTSNMAVNLDWGMKIDLF
jgi:hypothetical protein